MVKHGKRLKQAPEIAPEKRPRASEKRSDRLVRVTVGSAGNFVHRGASYARGASFVVDEDTYLRHADRLSWSGVYEDEDPDHDQHENRDPG